MHGLATGTMSSGSACTHTLCVQHARPSLRHRRGAVQCSVYNRPSISPYDDEYEFSLTQYMLVLEKPIGLTLAPDPLTGQVYVQQIQDGLSAAESMMVRVGDRLLLVSAASAVLGDDMWPASDLQRTRWAINNRMGKVKLVFERSAASLEGDAGLLPPWYFQGREGITSWQVPDLELPIRFDTNVGGELADSVPGVGRSLSVSFNRCLAPPSPEQARLLRPGLVAQRKRAEQLLAQLTEAAAAPEVEYASPLLKQLAADAARFQVGLPGSQPVQAPGSQNVVPFVRPGSSCSNNSSNNTSSSSNNTSSSSAQGQGGIGPPMGGNSNSNNSSSGGSGGYEVIPNNSSSSSSGPAEQLPNSSNGGNGGNGGIQQQQPQGLEQQPPLPPPPPGAGWLQADSLAIVAVAYQPPRVVQVLPWLLVSDGPLLPADLAQLATTRALSCLLEMRLCVNQDGLLCCRGQQPPPFTLPQEPQPPTLSPSESPVPAPHVPPPLQPAAAAAAEQQQQLLGQEQEQEQVWDEPFEVLPDAQQQQTQQQPAVPDPVEMAASMAGLAGPDMGFATAAVAAAAAAAAVEAAGQPPQQPPPQQQQQQQLDRATLPPNSVGGNSSSSSNLNEPASASEQQQQTQPGQPHELQPAQAMLQAHAVLHCMADLQRLVMRRKWRRSSAAARYSSSTNTSFGSGTHISQLPVPLGPAASVSGTVAGAQGAGTAAGGAAAAGFSSSLQQGGTSEGAAAGLGLSSRQVLLQCEGGRRTWELAGVLIAVWLHWCGGVEQHAAIEGVNKALGVRIDQAVLCEVQRLLLVRAKERFSRRILTWPYGGVAAEVSGELVGGWTERVSMTRCTNPDGCLGASKGHFYLELKGLHPGKYHYKYIIDNTWAVDGLAPKTLDSQGNWNNVLEVAPPPRIETPEEQAHYAALQAMCSAFERKLYFKRAGHPSMSH